LLAQQSGMEMPEINDEVDEHGTPFSDAWKSTQFSTQRAFKQTMYVVIIGLILLGPAIAYPFWTKRFDMECGEGFYAEAPPKAAVLENPEDFAEFAA
jgi:hypothetical protein